MIRSGCLLICALALCLPTVGCAGGGNGSGGASSATTAATNPSPGESQSKAPTTGAGAAAPGRSAAGSFVEQANRICKEIGGKFVSELRAALAGKPGSEEFDEAGAADFVEAAGAPALEDELSRLGALEVPPAQRAGFSAVLALIERTQDEMEASAKDFLKSPKALAEAEAVAKRHGLSNCPLAFG
jgi:hypothetical protein